MLDSGNLLFTANSTVPSEQELITAKGIAEIYTHIGYDAVAVGPHDLQAGIAFLKETAVAGFPWLSANLVDSSGASIFKPFRKFEKNGLTVGVIGVTGTLSSLPKNTQIAGWNTVLPPLLKALSASSDIVVVLSSLADSDNLLMMEKYPEIDILFSAERRLGNVHPKIIHKTLTSQVLSQGKYIGRLDIDWQKDRLWFQDVNREIAVLKSQQAKIDRRIQRAEILQRNSRSENSTTQLRQQREVVSRRLAALAAQQKAAVADNTSANTFSGSFVALSSDHPESREINDMLAELQRKIAMSYTAHPESGEVSSSCGQEVKKW